MTLVRYEIKDSAGWITLANPDRGNAFAAEAAIDLAAAIRAARHDDVGVLVLRAEGRFFSVTADEAYAFLSKRPPTFGAAAPTGATTAQRRN